MTQTPPSPALPRIVLVTPTLPQAATGNGHTAARWADWLDGLARVEILADWQGEPADALIALHARKSGDALARFAATGRPAGLVLTGTDLYGDLPAGEPVALASLARATRIAVLHPGALADVGAVDAAAAARTDVVVQSAPRLPPLPPRTGTFDLALVGHLRAEKDPMTAVRAMARLADRPGLRLRHAGGAHDAALGERFAQASADDPRIERLGRLAPAHARDLIRGARALLLPSRVEGGANVLIEAVQSGVPVIGARIPGTTGLLGDDHPGLFEPGDDAALAALVARAHDDPGFLERLRAAGDARAEAFEPERERAAVRAFAARLLQA